MGHMACTCRACRWGSMRLCCMSWIGQQTTYTFANLLDHLLRSSYPAPGDVQSAFVRFDSSSIRTTAELALSIDLAGRGGPTACASATTEQDGAAPAAARGARC
jgi:hypothetical protein